MFTATTTTTSNNNNNDKCHYFIAHWYLLKAAQLELYVFVFSVPTVPVPSDLGLNYDRCVLTSNAFVLLTL